MKWNKIAGLILFLMLGGNVWGQVYISGPVSGTLEDTTYIVTGDLTVQYGDELVIEPGAELLFNAGVNFIIDGQLTAVGAEADSIIFSTIEPGFICWGGIDIIDNHHEVEFSYCVISSSNDHGIYCNEYCLLTVNESRIIRNTTDNNGGGLCLDEIENGYIAITDCEISGNSASGCGGGIYFTSEDINIYGTAISGNHAGSGGGGFFSGDILDGLDIWDSTIENNTADSAGGGFYMNIITDGLIDFGDCYFAGNISNIDGGGIYLRLEHEGYNFFHDLVLFGNSAENNGGGIYLTGDSYYMGYFDLTENYAGNCGGGMYCDLSLISLTGIDFTGNNAVNYGGGLFLGNQSAPEWIRYCYFEGNSAEAGGGVYVDNTSYTDFKKSNFEDNYADFGGGIYINSDINQTITDSCKIIGNRADISGAGVFVDNSQFYAVDTEISANVTSGAGGGLYFFETDDFEIDQCTIVINEAGSGSGAYIQNSYGTFKNSISAFNEVSNAFYISDSSDVEISYNDFYNPHYGDISGNVPPDWGLLTTINIHGDSCDGFYNIFLDPTFPPYGTNNFHLYFTSPCINSGDPSSPLDPDNTIADMGAYYFPNYNEIENSEIDDIPVGFELTSIYPNPFNNSAMINFSLPENAEVKLVIYDLQGREVEVLADGSCNSGYHQVTFNAENLSSGIYFCRLQIGSDSQIKKLILLK